MIELMPTISTAIGIANRLKDIGDKLKHAELKELIGDLKLQLADLKIGIADLIEEIDSLRRKIVSLDSSKCENRNAAKNAAVLASTPWSGPRALIENQSRARGYLRNCFGRHAKAPLLT